MADQHLQHLSHLLERKQVFASFHYLNNLPPTTQVPNKQKLLYDLQTKIDTAKKLTANINSILECGDYPKALCQLKKAQSLVRDFPNIQTDIDFITASISTMEKNLCEAKLLARKGDKRQVNEILKSAQGIDKYNDAINEVTRRLKRRQRKKRVKAVISISLALIMPFIYFSFEQITLQQSKDLWKKADAFIGNQQYKQAEAIIIQMENRLCFVNVLGQSDKVRLLNIAANMSQSSLFIQGVQGNVGTEAQQAVKDSGNKRYVQSLIAQADEKIAAKQYVVALGLYDDALAFSDANIHIDGETVNLIQRKRKAVQKSYQQKTFYANTKQFNGLVEIANTLFRNDSWQEAAVAYEQALSYAKKVDGATTNEILLLKQGHSTSVINENVENGEIAFNQNRYDDAIAAFQKCLTFMQDEHLEGEHLYSNLIVKLQMVKEKQFSVKLSSLVGYGDQLYSEKEYELSIDNYLIGLALLEESNGAILGDRNAMIQKKIVQKIARAKEKILVQNQSQHLVATYKKILRDNFNLSRNIHFNRPQIVFIGNKDNHLIYSVSAFGSKSVSALAIKYEIDYKFNLKTGQWNVNDIRIEV